MKSSTANLLCFDVSDYAMTIPVNPVIALVHIGFRQKQMFIHSVRFQHS